MRPWPRPLKGYSSFVVRCVVLATADLTKKKNEVSSFFRSKVMEWFPKFKKVGHVTLATPLLGVIHHQLYTTCSSRSKRENTKYLALAV